jgi:hypothetical protein
MPAPGRRPRQIEAPKDQAQPNPFAQWYRRASPLDVLIFFTLAPLLFLVGFYVIAMAIVLIVGALT